MIGFRFISVIIAMLLVNVMPRVFASFDVQLKFESLLSLMFECRIGPIRKTVQSSLLRLNPDIFEKESMVSIKALNGFRQKSVKKPASSAKKCLLNLYIIYSNSLNMVIFCYCICKQLSC